MLFATFVSCVFKKLKDGAASEVCNDESNGIPEKDEKSSSLRQGHDEGQICGRLSG